MRGIRISLAIILSVLAIDAFAQSGLPTVKVQWEAPNTQEDGTIIPTTDVLVTVANANSAFVHCPASNQLSCSFEIGYSECVTLHAYATQISTGLDSIMSNVVEVCAQAKPNYPLSAPVITVTISQG